MAYDNAKTIAGYLTELGFNFDLAPVADVYSNPANTVIGSRAYSDDFEQAAVLVASAVRGFNDGGVACCLKHFPGHGDTAEDTHAGTAIADKSLSELTQQEFLPFISGIEAGADAVMTGHMTLTSIDPEHPSSLSYTVVTGLLRERLGYDGVVMTDALTMGALSNQYTADEIVVMAVQAGNDILLGPADVAGTISAIENAISTGELTEERINESVLRILELKLERGIIN